MFTTLWRFTVPPESREAFEEHYRSDGTWAQLFRKSPAYVRTDLLRDVEQEGDYVTIDIWRDEASYAEFREQHASEYAALDALCEHLTTSESHLGYIDLPAAPTATNGAQ